MGRKVLVKFNLPNFTNLKTIDKIMHKFAMILLKFSGPWDYVYLEKILNSAFQKTHFHNIFSRFSKIETLDNSRYCSR